MSPLPKPPAHSVRIAIACGGTGGHLFPGLAVAAELRSRGCEVALLISPKEVDQQAVKDQAGMEIITLPAVGLTQGRTLAFVRGFVASYRAAGRFFRAWPKRIGEGIELPQAGSKRPPVQAALAMGGFTSAPPLLAARRLGALTFLHESNTIPGRANRWLSWVVDRAFLGFPSAAQRLHTRKVEVTGTPVRAQFQLRDAGECRQALGLDPAQPVLLVMGGSQGAGGINDLVLRSLPLLSRLAPEWQWLHLAGPVDKDRLAQAYAALKLRARVEPFSTRMDLALGAATACLSRAGASSLAELAAMRLPAVLIPYPAATDNHQLHNARAFAATGAATVMEQKAATPELLVEFLTKLVRNELAREEMRAALAQWHRPQAAEQIAEAILERLCPATERGTLARSRVAGRASSAETPDRKPLMAAAAETALQPRRGPSAVACPLP